MINPFVPSKKIDVAVISNEAPSGVFRAMEMLGINTIPTIEAHSLQKPVANHPDMVLTPMPDGSLVAAPSVLDYYRDKLEDYGIKVLKGDSVLMKAYPKDVPYNVAFLRDTLIHRLDVTDPVILRYADKFKIRRLNTKQGYTKCSLAIVDDNSGITSDRGIYKLLTEAGFDILLVNQGYIDLPGMDYGFIGGATGLISPDRMVITGVLELHPDKDRIEEFLAAKGIDLICLTREPAVDVGTIIGLCGRNG